MKEQLTTYELANKLGNDRFNKHDFIAHAHADCNEA